jgi:hypothetical protein
VKLFSTRVSLWALHSWLSHFDIHCYGAILCIGLLYVALKSVGKACCVKCVKTPSVVAI